MNDPAGRVAVLRDHVEEEEKELAAAVRDLKVAARRMVGPAHWVREHPVQFLAGALVLGWWLGGRARTRRRIR
jgi:hypothetical protein